MEETKKPNFEWIAFYMELADKLLEYKDRRGELHDIYLSIMKNEGKTKYLEDFLKTTDTIDPFSIFGRINQFGEEERSKLLGEFSRQFKMHSQVPKAFDGMPERCIKVAYFDIKANHVNQIKQIDNCWKLFELAIDVCNPPSSPELKKRFASAYEAAVKSDEQDRAVISMALFWIRPFAFVPIDKNNEKFISNDELFGQRYESLIEKSGKSKPNPGESYLELCKSVKETLQEKGTTFKTIPELSYAAYLKSGESDIPETDEEEEFETMTKNSQTTTYNNEHSQKLIASKNLIFRGAPGTGKTYLAKQIAADIVSDGEKRFEDLSDEEKDRIGFVQFHPSYDYTDFVEGLRPIEDPDGSIGFKLKDGVFKEFIKRARKNCTDSADDPNVLKNYVFIIDEINRGEISKIFGELFFSIDPGYRGEAGAVQTQYANLHEDKNEKFYIPENVYIIGTMNDIDRSVDSFDFALRRRFRFIELKADEQTDMLQKITHDMVRKEAESKMYALNEAIIQVEDLNSNYQIGAAYFLKLNDLKGDFDQLREDYLQPLLQEYIQGMLNEDEIMESFKEAYDSTAPSSVIAADDEVASSVNEELGAEE
ncbi:MAG: AAA family ATPase [Phoenicibacter congonensis]|uniref:AAA family ATPase n=1 Tax=Phoenicibacter congonensis TaxID=1944646 RepID=A0AA43RIH1_9ACTN|nr:AAA family ATPase [Phoenicibacter congonensis]